MCFPGDQGSGSEQNPKKPLGIRLSEWIKGSPITFRTCQAIVLIITFFAYAAFHATRKTTSIVKSALDPEKQTAVLTIQTHFFALERRLPDQKKPSSTQHGWAPFNGPTGTAMLGDIDVAFLAVYSLGMYFAGHLGDRLDLRKFLTVGMIGTGFFTAMFGFGYWMNIHHFYYFLGIQMLAGLFQSTGWPSVVAVVGNWFGKSKRGLIMGIWNAHTSVGNISGSLIASAFLKYGWGWSFAIPGLIIAIFGIAVFLFLPVSPDDVRVDDVDDQDEEKPVDSINVPLLRDSSEERAVGFIQAWKIPGVAPYAFCLLFSKLVAYTFLYWLPFYISHIKINGEYLSVSAAGTLSTLFDVGGVLGGILAGHISDRLNASAITAASFMYCSIPTLFLYCSYGRVSIFWNVVLMFVAGMFVNGPYALITTAVSTDLGTHSSLNGNSRALATVTAIIDGTGSVGAAIGPLLTGYISARSWKDVFMMLMGAAFIAGLLLTKLVMAEVALKIEVSKMRKVAAISYSGPLPSDLV